MVQQQLIDYVKSQLKLGYTSAQVRSALLSAGYPQSDVEEALRTAGTKQVTTGMLVIAAISLLVLILGVLIILKVTSEPPAELDASVSLFTQTVAPGSDLVLSVTIKNTGGSTSGMLDISVSSTGIEIARKSEKFTVSDEKTIPVTVKIPDTATAGNAEARADISWGTRTRTASATFSISTETVAEHSQPLAPIETIKEAPSVETVREQQQTCSTSCDDLNFCTRDTCDAGKCVSAEIFPCCGNHQCESGENENTCAVDCAEEKPDTAAIGETAIAQSTTDFSAAVRTCQSLGQQNYVDLCLSDVSGAGKNKQGCSEISDTELRDGCYVQFAYSGDSEACTHIENPSMQGNCEQLIGLAQMHAQYPSSS